jgi:endonuclease YncB( thermonuclease family)
MEECTSDNTSYFEFPKDVLLSCKVVDVYDGDTCTGVLQHDGGFYKWKLRLHGFNAPEIRPLKSIENREHVIEEAKKVKARLVELVMDKMITIQVVDFDKYMRIVAKLYNPDLVLSVNEQIKKDFNLPDYMM